MSRTLTCPNGHRWILPAEAVPPDHASVLCPVCGTFVEARASTVNEDEPVAPAAPAAPSSEVPPTRPPLPDPAPAVEEVPPALARLQRYRIGRRLGAGGMGVVYLAHDAALTRPVALKFSRLSERIEPQGRARFLREARAAARLQHPNLCPVFDVGEVEGVPYFTMPYLEGPTLAELTRQQGPFDQVRAADLVRKVALALEEAHNKGVIHRDLKPSNVMLDSRGEPVVMDFGLACPLDSPDVRLTAPGAILGTAAYMSPEQARGERAAIGPASDVFSLGVVLYELLTGKQPFAAPSLAETLARVLYTQPDPPQALRQGLAPHLANVCHKAMSKRAEDRFATMQLLAASLAEVVGRPGPATGGRGGVDQHAEPSLPFGPELGERIATRYPFPIAAAYRALQEANSSADELACLQTLFEALVHFLATVAVSAYLHTDLATAACNRHLVGVFLKGKWTTGVLYSLFRDTLRLASDCNGQLPYPEALGYLFDTWGKPTPAAQDLESFIELCNPHPQSGQRSEDDCAQLVEAAWPRLERHLAQMSWLAGWALVRPVVLDARGVTHADLLQGTNRYKRQPFALAMAKGDLEQQSGDVGADHETLLLVSADRQRYLPLFPLAQFRVAAQATYLLSGLEWAATEPPCRLQTAIYRAYQARESHHQDSGPSKARTALERTLTRLLERAPPDHVPTPNSSRPPATPP
jgi:hypothetical protein